MNIMSNWKYSLGQTGKELREAIINGGEDLDSCRETMITLGECYKKVKRMVDNDIWMYCFKDYYDNFESDFSTLGESNDIERNRQIKISGYMNNVDMVNANLKIFYDLCDEHRIWVNLNL